MPEFERTRTDGMGRGILMSAHNGDAIAREIKHVTRRGVDMTWERVLTELAGPCLAGRKPTIGQKPVEDGLLIWNEEYPDEMEFFASPYGGIGTILPVKEPHYLFGSWAEGASPPGGRTSWSFRAQRERGVRFDKPGTVLRRRRDGEGWYERINLFMPNWAARSLIQIEGLRLEKLHDMDADEAVLEGVTPALRSALGYSAEESQEAFNQTQALHTFHVQWDHLHGAMSYARNPWVLRIQFKKVNHP